MMIMTMMGGGRERERERRRGRKSLGEWGWNNNNINAKLVVKALILLLSFSLSLSLSSSSWVLSRSKFLCSKILAWGRKGREGRNWLIDLFVNCYHVWVGGWCERKKRERERERERVQDRVKRTWRSQSSLYLSPWVQGLDSPAVCPQTPRTKLPVGCSANSLCSGLLCSALVSSTPQKNIIMSFVPNHVNVFF